MKTNKNKLIQLIVLLFTLCLFCSCIEFKDDDEPDEINVIIIEQKLSNYYAGKFYMVDSSNGDTIQSGSRINREIGATMDFGFLPNPNLKNFKIKYDVTYNFPEDSIVNANNTKYTFKKAGEFSIRCKAIGTFAEDTLSKEQTKETIEDFIINVK